MVSLLLLLGCNLSYIVDLLAALHEPASASARTLLKLASSVRALLKPYGDTLSSIQWAIWPKMRPARWGIWLSCQNVCQRSEAKGFRNSWFSTWAAFTGHCSCRFHVGFSVVVLLYSIVLSWNMPLFKVWSKGKLNNQSINQSTLFKHGKWLSKLVFRHAVW